MENKNLNAKELELTEQLLQLVNSSEEFELLQADKARLFPSYFNYLKGGTIQMENEEDKQEIKLLTDKQNALIKKLLESSQITKAERDKIVNQIAGRLVSSYDGSVLIGYLLGTINFRKYFNGGNKHKIAECFDCKTKVDLKRYEDIPSGKRYWLCQTCFNTTDKSRVIEVKGKKAVDKVEAEREEMLAEEAGSSYSSRGKEVKLCNCGHLETDHNLFIKGRKECTAYVGEGHHCDCPDFNEKGTFIDEKMEASADLHRKYDYPGGDVDRKTDINHEAQDQKEAVDEVEEAENQENFCN